METGKILQTTDVPYWMTQINQKSAYEQLKQIGLDINFNKHYNHGIELRVFDWFPETELEDLLTLLIHSADAALLVKPSTPTKNAFWNKLTEKAILEGKSAPISGKELELLITPLNLPIKLFSKKKVYTIEEIYTGIFNYIKTKYYGECCEKMIGPSEVHLARCFPHLSL
jgi:hypothetical protein